MDYIDLFKVIQNTGSSKANRQKYNLQLRNQGWSDNEIKTARTCFSNDVQCLSKTEQNIDVIIAYNSFKKGFNKIPKTSEFGDEVKMSDSDKTSIKACYNFDIIKEKIIFKLIELKSIYEIVNKSTNEIDELINSLS